MNPLIARTKHVQLIMLIGVFIMSLGIFLASFSSKVSATPFSSEYVADSSTALAFVPYPSAPLRHWRFPLLLPRACPYPSLLRHAPRLRTRPRPFWRRHWRSRSVPSPRCSHLATRHCMGVAHPRPLEPRGRHSRLACRQETRRRLFERRKRKHKGESQRRQARRVYLAGESTCPFFTSHQYGTT